MRGLVLGVLCCFALHTVLGQENILTSSMATSQNTIGWNGAPARAVDGNTNGYWNGGSCTHSGRDWGNIWTVSMGRRYAIDRVAIYNRLDCCSERINGMTVYVGDVLCGELRYEAGRTVYEVDCGGVVGDTINVRQPHNWMTLCEVQAFGAPSDEEPLTNVALNKPTWQSTTGWGGVSSRAVDGGINGVYGRSTCTHSANNGDNMWRVNLLENHYVDSVMIFNRLDCCTERIIGTQVYVGDELCATVEGVQSVYKFSCQMTGDVVKVVTRGQYQTLCEVQVIGKLSEDTGSLVNIAAEGQATQSSTGWNGVAERAIDGNTDGSYWSNSCTHTTSAGWWNLQFDEPEHIDSVIIHNRQDCCANRLNGVQVYADDVLCGTVNFDAAQSTYKISCRSDQVEHVFATNIRINNPSTYLTLCEVKVMSDPTIEQGDGLVNLAYLKPTTQSSTGWGGVPARAVDGNANGRWQAGTCTHTASASGWWMVDLEDQYIVERIFIKNRVDCCSDRINGVEVYVGGALCGTIQYDPIKYGYTVECAGGNGIVGQTVKIVNDNSYLTLCEVKVWGPNEPVLVSDNADVEVIGVESALGDDSVSVATCPAGKVVTFCEVYSEGVGVGAADGANFPDTGASCVAHNGWGASSGVIARAICSENEQVSNPCNGPDIIKYRHLNSRGANPSVQCPAGYDQVHCVVHSYWREMLVGKGELENGVIPNEAPCAIANCEDGRYCDLSIVCKVSDDYASLMCPDCDGYMCQDGYVCEMGDSGPGCVELQTGCDVDKCGAGTCLPVGASDYTCTCEEHYEFDQRAGSCLPVHSHYRTVYGDQALGDDAHSVASCNQGEKVMRCHTFGAPSAADGVYITEADGISSCNARASHSQHFPIIAVAYCGDDTVLTDPCTQDEVHHIAYRSDTGLSPSTHCPDGYLMESCIFHSPWSQRLSAANRARIDSIGSVDISEDGSCSMSDCLDNPEAHLWCKLTAVCKKLTGSDYLRAACPTCDQVRCNEGMECKMVDELPQCVVKIPGGCEVDRCGNGICIEDGPDYECECHQGYQYTGETCQDIDECAEEPCGNGVCTNTEGSYSCECDDGYALVEDTCEDINECLDNPCSETERCANIEGSYICDCLDTFISLNGECVCADGYENQDGACVDVDECSASDTCSGDNQVCVNYVGSYECVCDEGTELGEDGTCQEFAPLECDIRPTDDLIQTFRGKKVKVGLIGESKKVLKKMATITWRKNGEPWVPQQKGGLNGFIIRNFGSTDAGIYNGLIIINNDGVISRCEVEVNVELLDGSAQMSIANPRALMLPQTAGEPFKIKCDLDLVNVKLDDWKNPDNVDWYKVTEDGDVLLDDTDTLSIIKKGGDYQLVFSAPTPADSGTYRCEFNEHGVIAVADVTIEVVDGAVVQA